MAGFASQGAVMKRMAGVLLGTIVVVAACSSGGSSALSKDDFVKQGNAACQKGNDAINSAQSQSFSSQPTPEQLQSFFKDTVVPNIKKQIDEIDKLNPPKELQAQVDKLVTDARAALTKLQEQVDKDPSALESSTSDPFADVNTEANSLGLTVCGSSDSGSSSST
jgi:hypothetical protein